MKTINTVVSDDAHEVLTKLQRKWKLKNQSTALDRILLLHREEAGE